MSAKNKKDRAPSVAEVALGAALSIILGCALGAGLLVIKPVLKVKEIPKDAPANAVYYIEGSRDYNRTADVAAKRKAFAAGESVELSEGELNVLLGSLAQQAPAQKPGDKGPPPDAKTLDVGALNARIHDGKLQLSDTVTVNAMGATFSYIVQATGGFERRDSGFVFVPETFYVGGCPLQRLPLVKDYLLRKLIFAQPAPEDLAAAWPKLAGVAIEGPMLSLKMP